MNKAILLSGGMDSIALAYWKKPEYAITIDYGQKPALAEVNAAKAVTNALGIKHQIISVDCSKLGSGDLSNNKEIIGSPTSEWWPYRNQLLITLALMKGINLGIDELMLGTVKTDSIHKDGDIEFIKKISNTVFYQEGNIVVTAPAIKLTTFELIRKAKIPNSILLWAHSCHTSNEPCMNCNGCKKYLFNIQKLNLDV